MALFKQLTLHTLVFGLLVFGTASTTWSDTFSIPNPPNSSEGVLRPARGMSMSEVLREFGAPLEKKNPVGTPPITRWVYEGFIVSFEKQWVIHSSVKRR